MPYINKELRVAKDEHIDSLSKLIDTADELNYTITKRCHIWIKLHGLNYFTINSVVGVLECAKLELYRMIAASYENNKRLTNGSVSELDH